MIKKNYDFGAEHMKLAMMSLSEGNEPLETRLQKSFVDVCIDHWRDPESNWVPPTKDDQMDEYLKGAADTAAQYGVYPWEFKRKV